jgi:exodeoxyribonuclease X
VLIFFDLETTGLERDDKIVSCALISDDGDKIYDEVNEGKKIPPKASAIHHITNEMIKDQKPFKQSDVYKFLDQHNKPQNTLIAHNVKFDLEMLSAAGFIWRGKIVDTLRVTKHLIPECELFSLQVLRYELKLYKYETKEIVAHNAMGDVEVVKNLYTNLLDLSTLERMQELSFENVLLEKFEFGKYAGSYIEEISLNDRGYLEWMLSNIMDLDEDLRYSIVYYLEGGV